MGPWLLDWPWNPILLEPILMTQQEYDSHDPSWHWHADRADRCTLEMVNAARIAAHEARMRMTTTEDLIAAYAYGWFTWQWCYHDLVASGHPDVQMIATEWGTRAGEKCDLLPVVDFEMVKDRSIACVLDAQQHPQILSLPGLWHLDGAGCQQNWRDQGLFDAMYDPATYKDTRMPELWKTSDHHAGTTTVGRLPRSAPDYDWRYAMKKLGFALTATLLSFMLLSATVLAGYPVVDEPTWGFDPAWDEITLIRAGLAPGEVGWCAFYGAYNSDRMDHSLNVYIVNRSADGVIEDGGEVVVRNESNGYEGVMGIKPISEWQDWPSYKNDELTLCMRDDLGRKSDVIKLIKQVPKSGATLPLGFNLFHIGRDIGMYKCVGAHAEPTATPRPTPMVTPGPTATPTPVWAWEITEQGESRIVIELR